MISDPELRHAGAPLARVVDVSWTRRTGSRHSSGDSLFCVCDAAEPSQRALPHAAPEPVGPHKHARRNLTGATWRGHVADMSRTCRGHGVDMAWTCRGRVVSNPLPPPPTAATAATVRRASAN